MSPGVGSKGQKFGYACSVFECPNAIGRKPDGHTRLNDSPAKGQVVALQVLCKSRRRGRGSTVAQLNTADEAVALQEAQGVLH